MNVVLTAIAIGVGLLVFDQKPLKDAQAENAVLVGVTICFSKMKVIQGSGT